jgi:hypothetical protein
MKSRVSVPRINAEAKSHVLLGSKRLHLHIVIVYHES